jgi:hypothetical protein
MLIAQAGLSWLLGLCLLPGALSFDIADVQKSANVSDIMLYGLGLPASLRSHLLLRVPFYRTAYYGVHIGHSSTTVSVLDSLRAS